MGKKSLILILVNCISLQVLAEPATAVVQITLVIPARIVVTIGSSGSLNETSNVEYTKSISIQNGVETIIYWPIL